LFELKLYQKETDQKYINQLTHNIRNTIEALNIDSKTKHEELVVHKTEHTQTTPPRKRFPVAV